ncbi:ATP-binding protein [Terrabacter sp. 2RAF25]|uniref:ATP-binding protein n=1 Tax=Terrabacter sp. 2RAF25 TaxID=3232998 RepID=UPI003F98D1DC
MGGPKQTGESGLSHVEFGPEDLRLVRETVRAVAEQHVPERASDAMLAVHELAVNSIIHGGGHGVLLIDQTADSLVFTVEDSDGTSSVPRVREPAGQATSGRGLLIAQRLSDRLTIESPPGRTRVRLHLRLAPVAAGHAQHA